MRSTLMCPVCSLPLLKVDRSYRCVNNHVYDIAKEGYVNLLLANQKHSRQPGDNAQMIKSRRAFLDKGYYDPLVDTLGELSFAKLSDVNENYMLDAGCGEGYYLGQIIKKSRGKVNAFGMDISKEAVKRAAKRYKEAVFVVSSIAQLPFLNASLNLMLNIFAPRNPSEFHRILTDDGHLLMVNPAEGHLLQLREMIYDEVTAYNVAADDILLEYFFLKETRMVSFDLVIDQPHDIVGLFQMTPFYWSASRETQEQIMGLHRLQTTVAFSVELYQKK